jgi:hypothetical protein
VLAAIASHITTENYSRNDCKNNQYSLIAHGQSAILVRIARVASSAAHHAEEMLGEYGVNKIVARIIPASRGVM